MIIVAGGGKGGRGKSTIATNFAIMRARAGYEVLLVDAGDAFRMAKKTNRYVDCYNEIGSPAESYNR